MHGVTTHAHGIFDQAHAVVEDGLDGRRIQVGENPRTRDAQGSYHLLAGVIDRHRGDTADLQQIA